MPDLHNGEVDTEERGLYSKHMVTQIQPSGFRAGDLTFDTTWDRESGSQITILSFQLRNSFRSLEMGARQETLLVPG